MTTDWTFNIVYTPGTVSYLLPFVMSLLTHSDARFRLVANGCLPPERRMLENFANTSDRLEFWAMPGDTCQPHGKVLNALRMLETPGPFCFMDSDIVASGPFIDHLRESLSEAAAVFSGAPVWLPDNDGVFTSKQRNMGGEYIFDRDGKPLGCTYVAVYDAAALNEVCRTHRIGFEEIRWQDLERDIQNRLIQRGRRAEKYDTGKVINAMLPGDCIHLELTGLHHLGGFSFLPLQSKIQRRWPNAPAILASPLRKAAAYIAFLRTASPYEAYLMLRRRHTFRNPVRVYFRALLDAKSLGVNAPTIPKMPDAGVNHRLQLATRAINECNANGAQHNQSNEQSNQRAACSKVGK